jgi:gluconate 5-dehydrogenase
MDRWTGKVALVTGASVGIGMQIAIVLAKNGMKVIVAARRAKKLQELMVIVKQDYDVDLYPIRCDVKEEKDILKLFDWATITLGGIDVLINNAGTISAQLITSKLSFFFFFLSILHFLILYPQKMF